MALGFTKIMAQGFVCNKARVNIRQNQSNGSEWEVASLRIACGRNSKSDVQDFINLNFTNPGHIKLVTGVFENNNEPMVPVGAILTVEGTPYWYTYVNENTKAVEMSMNINVSDVLSIIRLPKKDAEVPQVEETSIAKNNDEEPVKTQPKARNSKKKNEKEELTIAFG